MKYKWILSIVVLLLAGCAHQAEDRTTHTYIANSVVVVKGVAVDTKRGTQQEPQSDLQVDLAYRMEQIMDKILQGITPEPKPVSVAVVPDPDKPKPPIVVVPPVVDPDVDKPDDVEEFPAGLSNVKWLHTDVSDWKVTGKLKSVKVSSSSITLDYDKAKVWSGVTVTSSSNGKISVNANPWIFVKQNDTWYAATFEWMKVGQTTKSKRSVNGDHIKRSPLDTFVPKNGETYGFMVSGLARDSKRNIKERTNIVMYKWGS